MKTKKSIISLFILGVSLLTACEGVLEKYPLNLPSTETFLENEDQIKMAIVGMHSPLYLMYDWIPFMIYFDNASDIAAERDVKPEQLYHNPSAWQLKDLWTYMYNGISRCNFILDNINRSEGKVSEEKMNQYKAEVKTMRAYYYHVLVSMFGDVPLIEHVQSLDEAYVTRDAKEKVVDFILSECEASTPFLSRKNEPNTMAITQGFAWAIAARTALYNNRWEVAVNACKNIMELEGTEYILDESYENLTKIAGKTSKEIIWAVQFNQDDKTQLMPKRYLSRLGGGYSNKMPIQALVDSYECTDGYSIDKSSLYDPQHPWENRDPRLGYTIALPGTVFLGYQFETNKDSVKCWNYNVTPATRIDNLDATHTYASFSGYCWRKYVDAAEYRTDGASSINAIVFRYAEILLTYAEAKVELNQLDDSVYESINKIRARVGMPPVSNGKSQQELRAAIRKERKYELAGEGLRLFDIRRWEMAEKVMNGICYGRVPTGYPSVAPSIDEYGNPDYSTYPEKDKLGTKLGVRFFDPAKHYLSPIPFDEIQTNKNLIQNPGY